MPRPTGGHVSLQPILARARLACALLALAGSFSVQAHGGATGVVKQRMDAMSDMAKAAKSIGKMVKGKRDLDVGEVAALAGVLREHAGEIPALFPDSDASRNASKTEAMPSIWEQRERFDGLAARLERESAELGAVAASEDAAAIASSFAAIGKTCLACHKTYRQKKRR